MTDEERPKTPPNLGPKVEPSSSSPSSPLSYPRPAPHIPRKATLIQEIIEQRNALKSPPIQNIDDDSSSNSLTPSTLQEVRSQLRKVPPQTPRQLTNPKQSIIGEMQTTFQSRGQTVKLDHNQVLECQTCLDVIDWPSHCFRSMIKQSQLYCSICSFTMPLPTHCELPRMEIEERHNIGQLFRLASQQQEQFSYKRALDLYTSAVDQIQKLNEPNLDHYKAISTMELGYCKLQLNRYRHAKYDLLDALDQFRELDNPEYIAKTQLYLATLYLDTGELDEAETSLEQVTILVNSITNYPLLTRVSLTQGIIARIRGDYSHSHSHLSEALELAKQLDNQNQVSQIALQQAITLKTQGHYDDAITQFELASDLTPANDIQTRALLYYQLVSLALNYVQPSLVDLHFDHLRMLYLDHQDAAEVAAKYHLAEALINKASNRMVDKAEALKSFKNMLDRKMYDHFEQRIFLMVNIADLLLQELTAFESEEALHELVDLIDQLSTISKREHSTSIFLQSSFLQVKLHIINSQFDRAYSLLDELEEYAQSRQLTIELQQVKRMKLEIHDQIRRIEQISDQHTSFKDLMKRSELNLYLQLALTMVDRDG